MAFSYYVDGAVAGRCKILCELCRRELVVVHVCCYHEADVDHMIALVRPCACTTTAPAKTKEEVG